MVLAFLGGIVGSRQSAVASRQSLVAAACSRRLRVESAGVNSRRLGAGGGREADRMWGGRLEKDSKVYRGVENGGVSRRTVIERSKTCVTDEHPRTRSMCRFLTCAEVADKISDNRI
jgi:hypothetical protein